MQENQLTTCPIITTVSGPLFWKKKEAKLGIPFLPVAITKRLRKSKSPKSLRTSVRLLGNRDQGKTLDYSGSPMNFIILTKSGNQTYN